MCELQLYAFMPLFVWANRKHHVIGGLLLQFLLILLSTFLNVGLCYKYGLTAGALSLENYYLFGVILNKPYTKLASYSIGIYLSMIYLDIVNYRRLKSEEERSKEYPKLHFLHRAKFLSYLFIFVGIFLIMLMMFVSYPAVKAPYSWTTA
jgi:uncharacterized membrane protein YidH (DUF202 family)